MAERLRLVNWPTEQEPDDLQAASEPFVGRWHRLVSTTNWEKGRIIYQWRESLIEQGASPSEYSDDAWSRMVSGVSAQHVGRLRRVYQRFGEKHGDFEGLYWSHFLVALEWDDAEMWLEGALQNGWSVSQMRRQRRETLGLVEGEAIEEEPIVIADFDEDSGPVTAEHDDVRGPDESPADADKRAEPAVSSPADAEASETAAASNAEPSEERVVAEVEEPVRPFENLPELPEDLAEALELFKLAILRHKTDGWQQVSAEDVIVVLQSLQQLVHAPSADGPPF